MGSRLVPVLTLVVGLALGAIVARWWGAPDDPGAKQAGAPVDLEVALEEPAENPDGLPRFPPEGMLPPEAETHPQYFAEEAEEEGADREPEALSPEIDFQQLEKLSFQSEVPHQTVGAWDESPESDSPGQRRAFVVVVEPQISDAELEALARDLRDQHRDARILNVRIYDSEKGARRAGWVDGGELAHRHLVAQVSINEGLGLDVIRVRGRRIEP
jgi:hypothetical protein